MPLFGDKVSDKKLSDLVVPQGETRTIEIPGKGSVEFPTSMSNDEVLAAVKKIAQPPAQPSFMARMEGGLTGRDPRAIMQKAQSVAQALPKIPTAPASLAIPGGAAAGPLKGAVSQAIGKLAPTLLGQAGMQGALAGGESLASGKGPLSAGKSALGAAAGSAVGTGVMKAGESLFSPAIKAAFEGRTGRKLAASLQDLVPAWKGLPKNAKGLYEMAHGEGENLLDASFKGAKAMIPQGHLTEVPIELAQAAKLSGARVPINAVGRDEGPIMVKVATRDLVENLSTLRSKGRGLANDAWRAIDKSLEDVPNQALKAARTQYRLGHGWVDFAEKGNFLKGEKYDAAKAMAALDKHGKELLSRGMQGTKDIVRGPLANPITKGDLGKAGTAAGAAGGLAAGSMFGPLGHLGGPIGGGYLGHMLGKQIPSYGNVPAGAVVKGLEQLVPGAGAAIGSQAAQ